MCNNPKQANGGTPCSAKGDNEVTNEPCKIKSCPGEERDCLNLFLDYVDRVCRFLIAEYDLLLICV